MPITLYATCDTTCLLSLPKWAYGALRSRETLENLVGVYYEAYTHTTELKQLKAGYLLQEMLDHFYKKTKSLLYPDRTLWIYSAHDITIAILLNALNLYDVISSIFYSNLAEILVNFLKFPDENPAVCVELAL